MLVPVALNPFPAAFWHLCGQSLWQDFRTHLRCVEPGPAALPLVLSRPPFRQEVCRLAPTQAFHRNASEAEATWVYCQGPREGDPRRGPPQTNDITLSESFTLLGFVFPPLIKGGSGLWRPEGFRCLCARRPSSPIPQTAAGSGHGPHIPKTTS